MGDVPNSWERLIIPSEKIQVEGLSWALKCSGKTLGYNQELKGTDET